MLALELLVVVVVGKARLDTSLDHLEVSFLESIWNVRLRIDLLHLLIDDTRLVATSVQKRASHLCLKEFILSQSFLSAFFLVRLNVELLFFSTHGVV